MTPDTVRESHTAPCPLCGASTELRYQDGRDHFSDRFPEERYRVAECAGCAVGITLPRETDSALSRYYGGDYAPHHRESGFKRWALDVQLRRDVCRLRQHKSFATDDEVFEIGSGNGSFLACARRAGFKVSGIEPSAVGRATAQERFGIELRPGLASELSFNQRHAAIVARHVLEHVEDPRSLLKKIFDSGLCSGGLLFLKIPRYDSWERRFFRTHWHGLELPRHRTHFSAKGLQRLLESLGYVDVEVRSEVVYPDLLRSLEYRSRQGLVGKLFLGLPALMRAGLAQAIALILAPLGAGRMIVFARRP